MNPVLCLMELVSNGVGVKIQEGQAWMFKMGSFWSCTIHSKGPNDRMAGVDCIAQGWVLCLLLNMRKLYHRESILLHHS